MNGFLKWFFVFMSSMLAGFGQIFKGLWNGIKQIFNIKNYIRIFKTYSADFGALFLFPIHDGRRCPGRCAGLAGHFRAVSFFRNLPGKLDYFGIVIYNGYSYKRQIVKKRKVEFLMEYKFTADNFQQEVLNSSQPVMVDFFANWCGPCQMMGPVIANLAEEYAGKIKIGKINVDENPGVAQAYEVATIPNLVFFKDGKVVNRVIGVVPDNVLKEKLDALLK